MGSLLHITHTKAKNFVSFFFFLKKKKRVSLTEPKSGWLDRLASPVNPGILPFLPLEVLLTLLALSPLSPSLSSLLNEGECAGYAHMCVCVHVYAIIGGHLSSP